MPRSNDVLGETIASMAGIQDSVAAVRALVENVSSGSQQQSEGMGQVSQAMLEIERVTQSTTPRAGH